jgi:hypothetical protein
MGALSEPEPLHIPGVSVHGKAQGLTLADGAVDVLAF